MVALNFGLITAALCLVSVQAAPVDQEQTAPKSRGLKDRLFGRAGPQVTINSGGSQIQIQGKNSLAVDSFWGIPFAAPREQLIILRRTELTQATGDLRFKPPTDPTYGSSIDATRKGNTCLQLAQPWYDIFAKQDEDCLFLNVQRPENTAADANLPVMVWMYVLLGLNKATRQTLTAAMVADRSRVRQIFTTRPQSSPNRWITANL